MTEPHAITRTRERYGLEITLADLRRMEVDCFEKKGIYFGDADGGAERWMIQCRGVGITVLFRRSNASIVTVLPKRNAVTKLIGGDELKRGAHKVRNRRRKNKPIQQESL